MRITGSHAPGNNFPAKRSKTIEFLVTYAAGDPNNRFYFPDDFELNGKEIVGIVANTCRQTFIWDGDINGTKTPGTLQYGLTSAEMAQFAATFVNEKGEEILQNTPLNCLNSLRVFAGFARFPGFVFPINCKLNLRSCYLKSLQPASSFNGYAVFTFYFND